MQKIGNKMGEQIGESLYWAIIAFLKNVKRFNKQIKQCQEVMERDGRKEEVALLKEMRSLLLVHSNLLEEKEVLQ